MSSVKESSDSHELAFVEHMNKENSETSTRISSNPERDPLRPLPLLVTPEAQTNIVKVQDSGKRRHRKKVSKKRSPSSNTPFKTSHSELPSLRQKRLFDSLDQEDQPQRKKKRILSDDEGVPHQVTPQPSVTDIKHVATGNLYDANSDISSRKRIHEAEYDSSSPKKMRNQTQPINTENTESERTQMFSDSINNIAENYGEVDKSYPAGSEIPVQSVQHLQQCQISAHLSTPTSEPSPPITQRSSPSYKTHQLKFKPHKERNSNSAVLRLGRENRPTLPRHKVKKQSPRKKQQCHVRQLLIPDLMKSNHHEGSTPHASEDISLPNTSTVACTADDSGESSNPTRTHAKHVQSSQISVKKKRRQRCRKCTSCSTPDCGECPECL